MPTSPFPIADPRTFPDADTAPPEARTLYSLAEASLGAETGQRADAADAELRALLVARLAGDGARLAAIVAGAPSVAVARHLWRMLDDAWCRASVSGDAGLAFTLFALPLVIVTGLEGADDDGVLSGVLDDPAKLVTILGESGAVGGSRTIALANALVGADALDIARLPEFLAWQRLSDARAASGSPEVRAFAPTPLAYHAAREAVHLRFLVGTAIARSGVDLLAETSVGHWGIPLTRELVRQLGAGRVSVLALPRAPQRLLPAVARGRAAQREVSAQIFASNAIRRFRATVGEPTAVLSAHRSPTTPGGGELRLSLSSPLDPRGAEGFRCPLHSQDRVGDVAAMLVDLLRDCRVAEVRVLAGVHDDRVPETGLPLLYKPDTIPDGIRVSLH